MTASLAQLQQALEEFLDASRSGDEEQIGESFGRLVACEQQLGPENVDPQLRHYLQRRSYVKALTYLQGGDPEEGSCGSQP